MFSCSEAQNPVFSKALPGGQGGPWEGQNGENGVQKGVQKGGGSKKSFWGVNVTRMGGGVPGSLRNG